MLKAFTGETTYRPKVIASYDNGYTVLTTSDDVGLMCYRYKNEPHLNISLDLDEITKIIGKKKNYELVISNNPHIEFYRGKKVIDTVPLSFTDADDLLFPMPDRLDYSDNYIKIRDAYKDIAFFNTAITDECDVVITRRTMSIRNHNSELVKPVNTELPSMAIQFMQFAHTIKSLEYACDSCDKIYFYTGIDLYIFNSDYTYAAILPYKKAPAEPIDLKLVTYIGHIKYEPNNELIRVIGKDGILKLGSVTVGPYIGGRFSKTISANKLAQVTKVYGIDMDVYTYESSLIIKFGQQYVIFY